MLDDLSAFLMGGKTKSVTFEQMNVWAVGTIIKPDPVLRDQTDIDSGEVLRWPNGEPKKQIVVTLQTDLRDPADPEDVGVRRLYVKGYMLNALRDAIKAAGAGTLQLGGKLAVAWTGNGEQKNKAYKPPKLYDMRYQAPDLTAAAGVTGPDPFTQPAQAAPAAQQSAPFTQAPAPQQQQSFLDRLRQQQPAPMFNAQGQPQSDEPPF